MILLSGVTQPDTGGAHDWFLANTGHANTPDGGITTELPVEYPLPAAKTFRAMSVLIPNFSGNESGVALTVTLVRYPAGSPIGGPVDTALTVSIPIAEPGNTVRSVSASVAFSIGDAFDVRVHTPTATASNSPIPITVVLS